MKTLLFETDWLASTPVFYNEKTGKASHNINEVIDCSNLEFDPEGFNNFLDFGYSVLEQTPIKNVKFLRHSSRLLGDGTGTLTVEYLDDHVEEWLDRSRGEAEVLDLLEAKVRDFERSCTGDIIIPTSGGYDSRLLNLMVKDKSRVRSFSYGVSKLQSRSSEVVYAKKVSEILGTRWEQIPIGDFHLYFDDWDRLFGASTHAHGMYHIEFYRRLSGKVNGGSAFMSGIIGDAWAGGVTIPDIQSPDDVRRLGYTHGISVDSKVSQIPSGRPKLEEYFANHRDRLRDPRIRIIEAMRFKMILLSYLMILPRAFGFRPWSPFLDIEIAMSMLNLPENRRKNRIWQKELFWSQGLDLESMHLRATSQNILDSEALHRIPVTPLDVDILEEVVKPSYAERINRDLADRHPLWKERLLREILSVPRLGTAMKRLGFSARSVADIKSYYGYLVLRPIQNLLERRTQR